jgi:hypothetical protein
VRRLDGIELDAADARVLLPLLKVGASELAARGSLPAASMDAYRKFVRLVMADSAHELPSGGKFGDTAMEVAQPLSYDVVGLAAAARVTPRRVRQFLHGLDESRLPRQGGRFGPIPAGVAEDFLAQTRRSTR